MEQDNLYKFSIYVSKPNFFSFKKRQRGGDEERSLTGHVFVGITNEEGVEKRIGFYPKFYLVGSQNVPREDVIKAPKDLFREVAGVFKDETTSRYNYVIQYNISKEQYDNANQYIEGWQARGQKYILMCNNCVSFALKTAKNIGLRPPLQLFAGIPTPQGSLIAIKIKKVLDEAVFASKKIVKKLSNFFGGVGKVVNVVSLCKMDKKKQAAQGAASSCLMPSLNRQR